MLTVSGAARSGEGTVLRPPRLDTPHASESSVPLGHAAPQQVVDVHDADRLIVFDHDQRVIEAS